MTKISNVQTRIVEEKTGQLSWMLDLSILSMAAVCAVSVAVIGGLWLRDARDAAPVVLNITAGQDPNLAEAMAGPMGAPLLWKLEKDGATVWLFGSVHQMPHGTSWMDQRLFAAFDTAERVWFESRDLSRLPPLADRRLSAGADVALFRRAKALEKPVGGFEADRSPRGRHGTGFSTDGVNVSLESWRSGDQRAMTAHVTSLAKTDPEIYRLLIRDRHAPWTPRIESMLSEPGASFVTLGAAHLVGPDGIVAQLRQRGHTVTRVDLG